MKLTNKKKQQLAFKKFQKELRLNSLAKPGPSELILVLDHLKSDFNIGKIYRSAYAFGIKEIVLVGIESFDPYPSKGCFKKVPSKFFESTEETITYLKEKSYQIFVLDVHTDQLLRDISFPSKSAIVICHEEFGPGQAFSSNLATKMKIKQIGDVESLNVSNAVSIAMYAYSLQNSC